MTPASLNTPFVTALLLSLLAGLCSLLGGFLAVSLHAASVAPHRVALWHAALGAALLFGGACDILPEAAAGLSPVESVAGFAIGAAVAFLVARRVRWGLRASATDTHDALAPPPRLARHDYHSSVCSMLRIGAAPRSPPPHARECEPPRGWWGGGGGGQDAGTSTRAGEEERREVLAVGLSVFLCMSMHNLLEGMSILVAARDGVERGVRLATAVSLENVPEGLAIALPILHATRCPSTALQLALWSGMLEPLGVVFARVLLSAEVPQVFASGLLAVTAGIFVGLAVGQILPLAAKSSRRGGGAELNAWSAFGIIVAVIFQPMLMYHGRVGAVR